MAKVLFLFLSLAPGVKTKWAFRKFIHWINKRKHFTNCEDCLFMVLKIKCFHLYDTFDCTVFFSLPMVLPGFNFFFKICFNTNVNIYLFMLARKEVV